MVGGARVVGGARGGGAYFCSDGSVRAAFSTHPPIEKATKLRRWRVSCRRDAEMKPSISAARRSAIIEGERRRAKASKGERR